jgi:molybdopterin-biosynthesis enzyme MoeA-like protein
MSTQQPEALRLADALNMSAPFVDDHINHAAAAELRRLHSVNAELLKELREISTAENRRRMAEIANAAIAKANGEQP